MTVSDWTDASDEEFRARFDRFGIFDEERVVEEVARAIYLADGWIPEYWATLHAETQTTDYRRLAAAAVAAYRATQDGGAEA